jgi:hypothetical protein
MENGIDLLRQVGIADRNLFGARKLAVITAGEQVPGWVSAVKLLAIK